MENTRRTRAGEKWTVHLLQGKSGLKKGKEMGSAEGK